MKSGLHMRKVVAVFLGIAMILTSLPFAPMTAYAAKGPADGQVEFAGGGYTASGSYYIETKKTITAVADKENYFDITLQTKTKRHHVDMSTDIVVVLDISNTMNADRYGNYSAAAANKKLTQAKAATNKFIDSFATNKNLSTDRKLAVVTFNSDAAVASSLREANDTGDATAIKNQVNKISAPGFDSTRRFTNIEAGLKLAQNILTQQSGAKFKYIILLTDGFPTTYIQSGGNSTTGITGYNTLMGGTYNASKINQDGYFANTRTKQSCSGGTSYSNKAAKKAEAVATAAKNAGINIFSVGIALASQNINNFLSYVIDTTGMSATEAYAIGNTDKTYRSWLENKIAGGPMLKNSEHKYADAYNQSELESDYAGIMRDVERAPEVTNREFYTIDPMSEVADFIGFFNKDGKLVGDSLTGQSKEGAEDTAVYNKSYGGKTNEDTIYWDKMKSGFTTAADGTLTFEIKYRVRLKNEKSGFQWETALETNEKTTLYYTQKYVESGQDVPGGSGTLDYQIPKAEGYKGSLKFKKVDSQTNAALEGAAFTLKHHGNSCDVCGGDAKIGDVTKMSGTDGVVSFDNIPSGHEYVLVETAQPAGYAPVHNHEIIVSYGKTYVGKKDDAHELKDGVMNGAAFLVPNTKIEPVELQLQVVKTMDGNVPEDGVYQFLLDGTEAHEGHHHEYASNQLDTGSGKSVATFSPLIFDTVGTYEYTISEVTGDDPATVYDDTVYTVTVALKKINGDTEYEADVTVKKGTEVVYKSASDELIGKKGKIYLIWNSDKLIFENVTRASGQAQFTAAKTLLDKQDQPVSLGDKKFDFVLEDAEGNVLQTKQNQTDGSITFEPITYDKVGTYTYTISEAKGSDSSIAYDDSKYDVIVEVTAPDDLKAKDAYQAAVTYLKDGNPVADVSFVNKERKIPTLEVTGLKTLNGELADSATFSFQHIELDDDGNEIAGTEKILHNDDNGLIYFNFDGIVEKMIEEYNQGHRKYHDYRLYEVKTKDVIGKETIIYDDTYYELFLAVDAPDGWDSYALSAYLYRIAGDERTTVFYSDDSTHISIGDAGDYDIHFDNASSVELNLEGTKIFLDDKGNPSSLKAGQFAFSLQDEGGNVLQTVKNQADGKFVFNPVTFKNDAVGKHTFVVYEDTADRMSDVYYDEAVYTADFEVKKDVHGHLSVTEPVFRKSGEAATAIAFANQEMNESHLQITVGKTVNGETPDIMKKFDFQLKTVEAPAGVDVSQKPLNQVVQNTEGHAAFEMFAFETLKAGRYVFEISEVVPAGAALVDGKYVLNKMTYDPTVHKVVVDVTKTGNVVEKTVTVNGNPVKSDQVQIQVNFDNQYDPAPAKAQLKAQKTLTGRDMKDGEFTFELADEKGKVVQSKTNQAAEAGAADVITFDELSFDKTGNYTYTVREKKGDLGGIRYDDRSYDVTVSVKDDNKGQLYAEILVNGNPVEKTQLLESVITFQNEYQTKDVIVQLVGQKTLEGRDLEREEFTFELYQITAAGKSLLQTIKNGSIDRNTVGSIAFETLNFSKPGVYQYEIREAAGTAEGVTYDEAVYQVTISVTDDGAGNLVAATSCAIGEEAKTEILFVNKYEPAPTPDPDPVIPTPEPEEPVEPENPDPVVPEDEPAEPVEEEEDSETPDTGDHTDMMLWLILLAAAGTGMAGTVVYKRRRNDE
ncbi:MAG: VWA domain-containing protein [Firmicutes bacterium]|nr:VWA domain-containing protein [Bacillota bacterium]